MWHMCRKNLWELQVLATNRCNRLVLRRSPWSLRPATAAVASSSFSPCGGQWTNPLLHRMVDWHGFARNIFQTWANQTTRARLACPQPESTIAIHCHHCFYLVIRTISSIMFRSQPSMVHQQLPKPPPGLRARSRSARVRAPRMGERRVWPTATVEAWGSFVWGISSNQSSMAYLQPILQLKYPTIINNQWIYVHGTIV